MTGEKQPGCLDTIGALLQNIGCLIMLSILLVILIFYIYSCMVITS